MATETIYVDMSTRNNGFTSFVNLAPYNSADNKYEFPSDGYISYNDSTSLGGSVRVYFPGTNTYFTIELPGQRQYLYVKKGMLAYVIGTLTAVRFYPLDKYT